MSFVQNSVVPFQRLRILLGVQRGYGKKAVRRALGRIVFVWRYCELSPISFSVFPVVLRFITGVFLLSIRSMQGFSVGAVGFRCLMVRC